MKKRESPDFRSPEVGISAEGLTWIIPVAEKINVCERY